MALAIHKFDTTEEAYDATQCDENISKGDILIVEDEKVVGIAYTWPIAITKEHGALHVINDITLLDEFIHHGLAFEIAQAYGWEAITK
jgi:hypothetical protein